MHWKCYSMLFWWSFFSFIFHRFPYDWRTPLAYLFTWAIQVLELVCLIASGYGFLCFYGSFCTLLTSFVGDIQENLIDFNDNIKSQCKRINAEANVQMRKQFCELIKFHVKAIQLSLGQNSICLFCYVTFMPMI